MQVITRFAPSPTGPLHTGSARTALFNYLFAKHCNGKFLLRIEDTDIQRSKLEFTKLIIQDLRWLGVKWDEEIYYQIQHQSRHAKVAYELIERGKAYYCYSTQEEIESFRQKFPHEKFISPWRDKINAVTNNSVKPTIRLKVNHIADSQVTVNDLILGTISINHKELDDMILLRSDGTPTYMLAVVVDDYDMSITHVIRGDDHLTNTFRQKQIYDAMDWPLPQFAHIPLIHDKDGHKLSKRNGAMGIEDYKVNGYLPQAVVNYLLRLGWSHGDQEIFDIKDVSNLFTLDKIGKSPAKFDIDKLNFINSHYIKDSDNNHLLLKTMPYLKNYNIDNIISQKILKGMDSLKLRAHTLKELADQALIYIKIISPMDVKSQEIISKIDADYTNNILHIFKNLTDYNQISLREAFENFATEKNLKIAFIMQSLRALLLGTFASPNIFEVIEILGKDECITRLKTIINAN